MRIFIINGRDQIIVWLQTIGINGPTQVKFTYFWIISIDKECTRNIVSELLIRGCIIQGIFIIIHVIIIHIGDHGIFGMIR